MAGGHRERSERKMRKVTARRKRRTARQVMKHGRKAKALHRLNSGRTGALHHKKTKSKRRFRYTSTTPALCPRCERFWIFEGLR